MMPVIIKPSWKPKQIELPDLGHSASETTELNKPLFFMHYPAFYDNRKWSSTTTIENVTCLKSLGFGQTDARPLFSFPLHYGLRGR
jgi:hypothetical protein